MSVRARVLITQFVHEPAPTMVREVADVTYWSAETPMPRDQLLAAVADIEGLIAHPPGSRIDREVLDRAPKLRVVSGVGVGYDYIDIKAATERGIAVCNTPGVLTDSTADLAFALILASSRRVAESDRLIRAKEWKFWTPTFLVGHDVSEATLGIIGLGRIGAEVARRASGFRMRVIYHNRHRRLDLEEKFGYEYVDLDTLLRDSDFVSVNVPLGDETRHLIGTAELAKMKPTAYLINTSRGPVVDEQALGVALKEKQIAGAGLDVFDPEPIKDDSPLLTLDNVVLTAHIASATVGTRRKMAELTARNLIAVLKGEKPPACVNPEVLS